MREHADKEASYSSGPSSISREVPGLVEREAVEETKANIKSSEYTAPGNAITSTVENDLESQSSPHQGTSRVGNEVKQIRLSFKDINPFVPIFFILSRWNNLAILISSGSYLSRDAEYELTSEISTK